MLHRIWEGFANKKLIAVDDKCLERSLLGKEFDGILQMTMGR
jgi:hypothetical protein